MTEPELGGRDDSALPPVDIENFEDILGVKLPSVWVTFFRHHVVVLSAVDPDRRRHWLAAYGRSGGYKRPEGPVTATPFGELIERVSHVAGFSPLRTDPAFREDGYHLELHDGCESEIYVGSDAIQLIKDVLRGLRSARPSWQLLQIFESVGATAEDEIELQRQTIVAVFTALTAIGDLGDFALDNSVRIVDNEELSQLASAQLSGSEWNELRDGSKVGHGARRLTPEDPEWKERLDGDTSEVEGVPPPTSEEVIAALTDRVGTIADPLARLVLLDELSRDLMPAVYEQMMQAAADLRAPVAEGGQGGTWRQIGEALGITPQAARNRLDPTARAQNAERARRNRTSE